jgi:hypothetical protein
LNGEDLVVKEGYSNFRRPELRDFKDLLDQIVDDLYSYKESKRIVRRKRKVTPDKIVKYIKLSDQKLELNGTTYSSLPAEQLVGAKHIFLYNIEKRELTYYTGRSLSIRRTVVDGFDKSKSWSRTLRKPEQFLSDIVSCTKFNVENIGDNLTTKPKIPSGRIVSKQILIKVIS